jgi:hypothetical protein
MVAAPRFLRVRWLPLTAAGSVLALLVLTLPAADPKPGETNKPADRAAVEVRFTDNSTLKLMLLDEKIDITTPYGKLSVPVADVQMLEFATRIPEEVVKKVEKAIADLGSPEFKAREIATAELLKLGEKAYPALVEAAKSNDAEVKRRAESVLERIKQNIPAENLKVRKNDVLTTEQSKFSGRIDVGSLRVNTTQFGEVQLKLSDARSLRSLAFKTQPAVAVNAQPDPGSLTNFANQFGQVLYFRVTGNPNGSLWGTDVYTTDSTLAMAAVHAGVLKAGETGVVKVMIVVPPPNFQGTARNGVTSSPWDAYPAAFTVSKLDGDN